MTETLALLGGDPVRTAPYPIHDTMIGEEEEREVLEALRSKHLSGFSARPGDRFLGGPKVRAFEAAVAEYFGVKYAVTFNSATSALHAMVSAVGAGPGDEVIVPPTTMSATATAVVMNNAVPIFADIENETYGLDPAATEAAITPQTKAILAVNLFGHAAQLHELEAIATRHNLVLLEDNSQSPGAKIGNRMVGTVGRMAAQSLNYHKAIQTGEGGVVLTNDDRDALHLQLIRNHGEVVIGKLDVDEDQLVNVVGYNYRLSEVQAAIGIPQVAKLNALLDIRYDLAGRLIDGLKPFDFLIPPVTREDCTHVYYLFPIRYLAEKTGVSRSAFVEAVAAEGVALAGGYVQPIYMEPMFQKLIAYGDKGCPFKCPMYEGNPKYSMGICPTAETLYGSELMTTDICKYPNGPDEVDELIAAITKVAANFDHLRDRA